uniref:RRM domain-containing protein n=1 Tax=Ascaris lumbricoides TaxID=6252 RepID=A0A9J2PHZ2_ASCLU
MEDIPVDVARSVLVKCLPSTLYDEPDDSFKDAIYELLEKTFCVDKDAVDRIIRFPKLDPQAKEFGCQCVIMFRSRVLKHRVIAQKSKLYAPTEVESISEVPKELSEPVEDLELADESTGEDDAHTMKGAPVMLETQQSESTQLGGNASENAAEAEADGGQKMQKPAAGESLVGSHDAAHAYRQSSAECAKIEAEEDTASSLNDEIMDVADSIESDDKEEHGSIDEKVEESTEVDERNQCSLPNDVSKTPNATMKQETTKVDSKEAESKSATGDATESAKKTANTNLPPLFKFEKHLEEHFMTLPIEWNGAPEFQWRIVNKPEDPSTLLIENAMPSDMVNPWLYTVIQRAERVETCFRRQLGNEVTNDSTGSIRLLFPDDRCILPHTINYLVYIRTPMQRRLKIYLPQTPPITQYKDEVQKRLGRVREPSLGMRQLILKPLSNDVTEESIRTVAFKHHEIESVEFKDDAIGQRCAILTFSSVERAIAAHFTNNCVRFDESTENETSTKVLYAHAAIRGWWGPAGLLLTRGEAKAIRGAQRKERRMSGKQLTESELKKGAEIGIKKVELTKSQGSGSSTQTAAQKKQADSSLKNAAPGKRSNQQSADVGTFPKKSKPEADAIQVRDAEKGVIQTGGKPSKDSRSVKRISAPRYGRLGFGNASAERGRMPSLMSLSGGSRFGRGASNTLPAYGHLDRGPYTPSPRSSFDDAAGFRRGTPTVPPSRSAFAASRDFFTDSRFDDGFDPRYVDTFRPVPPRVMDMSTYDARRSRTEDDATPFVRPQGIALVDEDILHEQRKQEMMKGGFFSRQQLAASNGVKRAGVEEPHRTGFFFGNAWR